MSAEEINRCIFWVSANRKVRDSGHHNFEKCKIKVNSNWDTELMKTWLQDYHDSDIMDYINYGWPLNAHNTAEVTEVPSNQQGALQHHEEMKRYIKKELEHGSIIGPFKSNPFDKSARFSPIDTRPKRNSDQLRVIMNLSYPHEGEKSVNHSINKDTYCKGENMKIKYPTVEDLCRIVRLKGKDAKIFIRDLSRAYRQLWSCPGSIHLAGFSHDSNLYFDVTLSMGSASSAYCCQRVSNAITHIFKNHRYSNVNYLDDLGGAETSDKATQAFECLGQILKKIGIQESEKKATPPCIHCNISGSVDQPHHNDARNHTRQTRGNLRNP